MFSFVSRIDWAFLGLLLIILSAPFERAQPLLELPGQALTTVEAVVVLALLAWITACLASRRRATATHPALGSCVDSDRIAAAVDGNRLNLPGNLPALYGQVCSRVCRFLADDEPRGLFPTSLVGCTSDARFRAGCLYPGDPRALLCFFNHILAYGVSRDGGLDRWI